MSFYVDYSWGTQSLSWQNNLTDWTDIIHWNITETCPGSMNAWKFGKLQKKSSQNLTRCKIFNWKSDALYFLKFKISRVVFFKNQNLTRCVFFISESDALQNFQIKIWRVVKILFQNLTRYKIWIQNLTGFETGSPKYDFHFVFHVAEAYLVLLHCWATLNLRILLTYTLSCYIAVLFPVLKHFWRIP